VRSPRVIAIAQVALSILGVLVFLRTFALPGPGFDVYAYWTVDPLDPYVTTMDFGAFHYAPPLAWPAIVTASYRSRSSASPGWPSRWGS